MFGRRVFPCDFRAAAGIREGLFSHGNSWATAHVWLHRLGFVQGAVSERIEQLRSLFMLRHTRDLCRTALLVTAIVIPPVVITSFLRQGYLLTNRIVLRTAGQPLFRRTPGAADNLRPRENVPPVLHACIYPGLQDTPQLV